MIFNISFFLSSRFLENTHQFYSNESNLINTLSFFFFFLVLFFFFLFRIVDYIHRIEKRMNEEILFCNSFLNPSTLPLLKKIIVDNMVVRFC
jgi:hypothetical protein